MMRFLIVALAVVGLISLLGIGRVDSVMERRVAAGEPMSFEQPAKLAALWPERR